MNCEKVNKYFRRIGMSDFTAETAVPGSELLRKLQFAHVTSVPYENIDILTGKPLPLEPKALFEKIVENGRGGYCFELNCLFSWLLSELGYKVKNHMARYLRGEEGIPMRRHRVMTVILPEGRFLCDVGVGDSAARWPVMLGGTVSEQFGESYRIEHEDFFGNVLYDLHNGKWRRQFSFTEEEQLDIDYVMPSYYCENHSDSIFKKTYMISIKTASGRMTIDGMKARVFDRQNVVETELKSGEELYLLLKERFGITL